MSKRADKKCIKCGKPGATSMVVGPDGGLKGPYCAACKPK